MHLTKKRLLLSLALPFALPLAMLLGSLPATAQQTAIAQAPLLTSSDTGGVVKPNLMLLYDNSGSMNYIYTPDYVAATISCRGRGTMKEGTRSCTAGDPPFASADFNRQYYDPAVRYLPPIKADGTSHDDMTRANTGAWTKVKTDAYDINKTDLLGNASDITDLANKFPDATWCSGNTCSVNTTGYVYPTNSRYTKRYVEGAPYYYSINVSEYCTDTTLSNCVPMPANGEAPRGYPIPSKVRFCDSTDLDNCQGKYVGDFKYPRFPGSNDNAPWWGTITIGASAGNGNVAIDSVSAAGPAGTEIITNGPVSAANGTATEERRIAMANALAASIVARTGLANPFTACVTTPLLTGVPSCTSFGITLGGTNMVGVIPLICPEGATSKNSCAPANDNSRAGESLMVLSGSAATALLTFSGTSHPDKAQTLASLSLGKTALLASGLTLERNIGASAIAAAVVKAVNNANPSGIRAYVGGSSETALCQAQSTSTVCLVNTASNAEGLDITLGELKNNTYNNRTRITYTVTEAVSGRVPTTTTNAGTSIFVRTNIVPTRTSYPRGTGRTDCKGATCTYDEEMTNFANWYTYYKSRNQMMKTAVGQAFGPVTDKYNVGLVALSVAASANPTIARPEVFSDTNRENWYKSLYGMNTSGSTPVRQALHAIGQMYANKASKAVEYACQQNFTFITTDGYWNGGAPRGVSSIDESENKDRFCLQGQGCVHSLSQSVPSLADIALFWYNGGSNETGKSLRPDLEDMSKPGMVPATNGENSRLHMKTYALGLGVDGIMTYEPDYDTAANPKGDFYKLITGATSGCPWNGGKAWVWPDPETGNDNGGLALQSRVDDLWHAAINGHGKYFSASDPTQVIDGLRKALANIQVKTGAASAAATSTPNISEYDRDIFLSTYTTVRWTGRLVKRAIGAKADAADLWNSSYTLGRQVDAASDSRTIYMLDPDKGGLVDFAFANFKSTAEQNWFQKKCSELFQCANMSAANQEIVNNGATIIGWLRGQQQHADNTLLRAYSMTTASVAGDAGIPEVLGDIASSKPAYVRDPRRAYTFNGYDVFQQNNSNRDPTVYVGANDGMLHAFDAKTGEERWAYVPRTTMKKLYRQAGTDYSDNHQYSVDGSPEVDDVFITVPWGKSSSQPEWRTVLVGGLNAGGRGYYALDVTEPATPRVLWEMCADAAACTGTRLKLEPELGLTFGNPQFGMIKVGGVERWVVFLTSGYNNVPNTDNVAGGTGKGWLFVVDVATGNTIYRLSTNQGSVATPSGFAKISAISADPHLQAEVTHVYGGDNLGKMWRFDFTKDTPAMNLMGDAGPTKPVTTRPEVTTCLVVKEVKDANGNTTYVDDFPRIVVFGTGRLLDLTDVKDTAVQSLYVLKDLDDGKTLGAGEFGKSPAMAKKTLARQNANDANSAIVMSGEVLDLMKQKGWFVDFTVTPGERINVDPKVIAGTLSVVTNVPDKSTACAVGGTSNIYQFNVCKALNGNVGISLPGAVVGSSAVLKEDGTFEDNLVKGDGTIEERPIEPSVSSPARRIGWRRVRN